MRMLAYYAFHTFINQIRKLLKAKIILFILLFGLMGGLIGLGIGMLESATMTEEELSAFEEEMGVGEDTEDWAVSDDETGDDWSDNSDWNGEGNDYISDDDYYDDEPVTFADSLKSVGIESPVMALEAACALLILVILIFECWKTDEKGNLVFLPADVNLLFPSPMRPQSVLIFRLMLQIGTYVIAGIYFVIELPQVFAEMGFSLWQGYLAVFTLVLTVITGKLLQVLIYLLDSTHRGLRKKLSPLYLGIPLVIAFVWLVYWKTGTGKPLGALAQLFSIPWTRWIPVVGWLKGILMFSLENKPLLSLLCFVLAVAVIVGLAMLVYRTDADFYEDALARSQEVADLQEKAAKSGKLVAIGGTSDKEGEDEKAVKRRERRARRAEKEGIGHGAGASVYFFKTLYNRFRFASFNFVTKTMVTYLVIGVGVAVICRLAKADLGLLPVVLALSVIAFFRALGNPLEEDTGLYYFRMIPENPWGKLFWSLLGGLACTLLDAIPALLIGAVILQASPLAALAGLLFVLSVDYYSTNVSTFVSNVIPPSADNTIKQFIVMFFLYFGLVPDAGIIIAGAAFNSLPVAMIGAVAVNLLLGSLFFGLTPNVLEPAGLKRIIKEEDYPGDLSTARSAFNWVGFALLFFLGISFLAQLALLWLGKRFFPSLLSSDWGTWLVIDVSLYLIALPVFLALIKKVPGEAPQANDRNANQAAVQAASLPADQPSKFSFGRWLLAFLAGIFLAYTGNLVTQLLLLLVGYVVPAGGGTTITEVLTEGSLLSNLIFVVIIAPVMEEFVFRKTLITKLRPYGERTAVVVSAVCFGLFHGNFSQMLYAALIGLVLGYVYLRTNKIIYTILLHAAFNAMSALVLPKLLSFIDFSAMTEAETLSDMLSAGMLGLLIYLFALVIAYIVGYFVLCACSRRVYFNRTALELPTKRRQLIVWGSLGMILFVIAAISEGVFNYL